MAWWTLDESGGPEAGDASGQGHGARVHGAARRATGPPADPPALGFDGVSAYVDAGDHAAFDFRHGLTASFWFRPGDGSNPVQTLLGKGTDAWQIQWLPDKRTVVLTVNGPQTTGRDVRTGPRLESRPLPEPGCWHHVAATYDGRQLALHLDGDLDRSLAASGPLAVNTEPLWLGNNAGSRAQFFHGWLRDVRLFDHGLSEKDIRTLASPNTP